MEELAQESYYMSYVSPPPNSPVFPVSAFPLSSPIERFSSSIPRDRHFRWECKMVQDQGPGPILIEFAIREL